MQQREDTINFLTTYNEVTGLTDESRAMIITYLPFRLSTIFFNTFTVKFLKYGLGRLAVKWTENWLNGQDQKLLIRGTS